LELPFLVLGAQRSLRSWQKGDLYSAGEYWPNWGILQRRVDLAWDRSFVVWYGTSLSSLADILFTIVVLGLFGD